MVASAAGEGFIGYLLPARSAATLQLTTGKPAQ
jgi:hypothetical protein